REPHTHLLTCRGRSESATRDHQLHRSVLHEHAYVLPGRDRGRRRDRRLDEEPARRERPSRYPAEHVVGPRVCPTSPCDTALELDDVAPTGTIAADANAILCAHSRHRR